MSASIKTAALRQAVRAARGGSNILLYSNGGQLVLVLNAVERGGRFGGHVITREVKSAGLARAVLARFVGDLHTFANLRIERVLDASIAYAEATWRFACRRAGRRCA